MLAWVGGVEERSCKHVLSSSYAVEANYPFTDILRSVECCKNCIDILPLFPTGCRTVTGLLPGHITVTEQPTPFLLPSHLVRSVSTAAPIFPRNGHPPLDNTSPG